MTEILGAIVKVLNLDIFSELFKGKEHKKVQFELALMAALEKQQQQQNEINKIEASHSSIWVSGWRPFIGWVCGSALAYNFMVQPLITVVLSSFGVGFAAPALAISELITILLGLLGMGAYRSYDKTKLNNVKNR